MKKLLSSFALYYPLMLFVLLSVPGIGSAQIYTASAGTQTGDHPKPQPGMVAGKFNYTSFRKKIKSHDGAWFKYNDPSYYNHPEFGILPEGAPENCIEILSKRNVDERFFRSLSDTNRIYQQKALGDLSMLKNGRWITIDHKLQPAGNGKYTSVNTQEPVSFDIPNRDIAIHTVFGKISFNNWKLLAKKSGQLVTLAMPDWTNYTIGEDGMYVTDIFRGIDAELKVFRGVIKTNFIIKTNEFGSYEELIFRDEFNEGNNTSIRFTENAQLKRGVGQLTVFNNGRDALKVDAGVAYARFTKERSIELIYAIEDKWMDVVVPAEWISENIGKYELVVDPIVTASNTLAQASITGSRYNASCNFTNSCDYNLNVAQPANTTITNISYNFSYVANGSTCWLQDGAIKIGSGACLSPSVTGYFWFCNGIGGGTCNASNSSIIGDLKNCMPAPSCTVQNIPFTLKFYRACWGASGCSNTCIGAASPWTMTLECEDISLNNPSAPINTPALMVCQGLSPNLSASAKNGVPPYTYSWSFDPSGTPVAATGASANVTFPGNGTHTVYVFATDACNNTVSGSQVIGVSAPVATTDNVTICNQALPYTWNGQTITAGGNAVATYTTPSLVWGCDSTVTLNLNVNAPLTTTETITICAGLLPYTWNGQTISAGGNAVATYTTPSLVTGCDSTVTLNLNVNAPLTTTETINICAGLLPYTWNGQTITAGGNAVATYTTPSLVTGCDSTVTLNLNVNAPLTTTETITICAGLLPYTWNGQTITAGGNAIATYTTPSLVTGCDSTVTLNLNVNAPLTTTETITICDGLLPYTWNGQTITAGGNAVATYTTPSLVTGCDSTVTLNMVVNLSPAIVSQPANASIFTGDNASFTVSANGTGSLSFQWQVNTGSGFVNIFNGGPYSGADAATLSITNVVPGMNGYLYRCVITGNCAPSAITNDARLVVSKRPQTINLPAPANGGVVTVTYGDNAFSAAATASSGLPVNYSSSNNTVAAVSATGQIEIRGAGTALIAIEQPGDNSYAAAPALLFTVHVNKKDLYVQADDKSRPYGEANPALSKTYTGFVNGEDVSVITEPFISTAVVITTNPGTYPITLSGGAAANYNLVITDGTFTVTGARVFITEHPQNQEACEGKKVAFTAKATAASVLVTVAYQWEESNDASNWQPVAGATAETLTLDATGGRFIRCLIQAPGTQLPTRAAFFTVNPSPVVRATKSNDLDCNAASAKLNASGALTYVWGPVTGLNNPNIPNPVASPADAITYTVTGTDAKGCKNSDSVRIEIITVKTGENVVANAFTPNRDGRNDCFGIRFWGIIEKIDFSIYNRFGQRVFSTTVPGTCWDGSFNGQAQPPGTYVYTIRAVTKCGTIERRGTVTLIR